MRIRHIIERGIMDSDDIRAVRYRGFQAIAYALILIRLASFPLIDIGSDPAGLLGIVFGKRCGLRIAHRFMTAPFVDTSRTATLQQGAFEGNNVGHVPYPVCRVYSQQVIGVGYRYRGCYLVFIDGHTLTFLLSLLIRTIPFSIVPPLF